MNDLDRDLDNKKNPNEKYCRSATKSVTEVRNHDSEILGIFHMSTTLVSVQNPNLRLILDLRKSKFWIFNFKRTVLEAQDKLTHSCQFPPQLGGNQHQNFPPNRFLFPPKVSPPIAGKSGSPPRSQKWGGTIFGSPPNLEGNTYFFMFPSKFGGEIADFPPNFGVSPPNLVPCNVGGETQKKVWGGTQKFPPQLLGFPPQSSPPTFWKTIELQGSTLGVPPLLGGLTTMM